jgi:hypothetical protein
MPTASVRTPSFWIFSVLMRTWFADAAVPVDPAETDSSSPS